MIPDMFIGSILQLGFCVGIGIVIGVVELILDRGE